MLITLPSADDKAFTDMVIDPSLLHLQALVLSLTYPSAPKHARLQRTLLLYSLSALSLR